MSKLLGIFGLLVFVCAGTYLANPAFGAPFNVMNMIELTSLFGIISIGVAFVIITGGIDLSIGSVIGLIGCLLPMLMVRYGWHPAAALAFVLSLSACLGLIHGLLITKLKLQPFVVTLCGLLIYRGLARAIANDQTQGFGTGFSGLKQWLTGNLIENLTGHPVAFDIPMPALVLIVVTALASFLLNMTVWGRYLFALGRNEEAARYSGINTDRMVILSYVICSFLAGVGGILFVLDINSGQPTTLGNFYELYAIAAAVLGGCSLRGGEGTIIGVVIGTAVMRVLKNSITMLHIPSELEFAIIGFVILLGVVADELVRRLGMRRRRKIVVAQPVVTSSVGQKTADDRAAE